MLPKALFKQRSGDTLFVELQVESCPFPAHFFGCPLKSCLVSWTSDEYVPVFAIFEVNPQSSSSRLPKAHRLILWLTALIELIEPFRMWISDLCPFLQCPQRPRHSKLFKIHAKPTHMPLSVSLCAIFLFCHTCINVTALANKTSSYMAFSLK